MNNTDKFNKAYAEIINQDVVSQGFFKGIATKLGKAVGMSGQKMIHKTLTKALKQYGFEIGDGDQQDFTKATKIVQRKVKDKQNPGKLISKFYKIIITNDYDVVEDKAEYGIKCINAVTGKSVKIKARNFILKDSQTANEIIEKVVNPCIAPLKIVKDKANLSLLDKLKARFKDGVQGIKKAKKALDKKNIDKQAQLNKGLKQAQDNYKNSQTKKADEQKSQKEDSKPVVNNQDKTITVNG